VERVGMPEGRIILGQATVMLATSPKSNKSYLAVDQALADVRSKDTGEVPLALRNAVMQGMGDNLGYGQGYRYAHDYPHSIAPMEFMPDKMRGVRYYEPTENGYEKTVKSWLENINSILKSDQ
jgi:putative ATPase